MNPLSSLIPPVAAIAMLIASPVFAGAREDQLARYATAAKAAVPGFTGFSAARGKALHNQNFTTGKADTPACNACHGKEPSGLGRTPAGKVIDAMAVSVTPARYTDPAKVEKWFKRNCNEVIGRECSAQEKGDWLAYMVNQ